MSKTRKKTEEVTPEDQLVELQNKLQKAQETNQELHSQMEGAKVSLKSNNEQNRKENARLLQIEVEHRILLKRHNSEVFKLKQKVTELTKSRDSAILKASQVQIQLSDEQKVVNTLKGQITDLNHIMKDVRGEVESRRNEVKVLCSELAKRPESDEVQEVDAVEITDTPARKAARATLVAAMAWAKS